MAQSSLSAKVKWLSVIPVIALLLAGCTSAGGASKAGGDTSAPAGSHLAKIIKDGTIRVAVLADYPPFSVQNASGKLEGYEPDIAQKLADALGVKLELVSTDGAGRLPLLQSGRADINISSWTATNERAKAVGFTIPYVSSGALPLFKKSNPITSFADLAGKKIAVARGSTNDTIVTQTYPKAQIVRFESIADAIAALKAGKVDATLEGQFTVQREVSGDPQLATLDAPPLRPSIISMGVLPSEQVLLNYLDNFVRNLTISGDNQELYHKWFKADLPAAVQ